MEHATSETGMPMSRGTHGVRRAAWCAGIQATWAGQLHTKNPHVRDPLGHPASAPTVGHMSSPFTRAQTFSGAYLNKTDPYIRHVAYKL